MCVANSKENTCILKIVAALIVYIISYKTQTYTTATTTVHCLLSHANAKNVDLDLVCIYSIDIDEV